MTPYHLAYDPVFDCYYITEVGLITADDAVEIFEILKADKHYQRAKRVVADVRRSRTNIGPTDLARLIKHAPRNPEKFVAIVMDNGLLVGVYKQLIKLLRTEARTRFFNSMDEAMRWMETV